MTFDPTITFGGVGTLVSIATLALGVFVALRTIRRENASSTQASTNEIKATISKLELSQGERISRIEGQVADFVPRSEIKSGFDHERQNRQQMGEAFGKQIQDLLVKQGIIQARQDQHEKAVDEIKGLVREGFRDQAAKFDRLAESIATRA